MVVIAKTLIMQSWLRRNPIYIIIKSAHNKLLPVKVHYVITSFNYTGLIEIASFQYNFIKLKNKNLPKNTAGSTIRWITASGVFLT